MIRTLRFSPYGAGRAYSAENFSFGNDSIPVTLAE